MKHRPSPYMLIDLCLFVIRDPPELSLALHIPSMLLFHYNKYAAFCATPHSGHIGDSTFPILCSHHRCGGLSVIMYVSPRAVCLPHSFSSILGCIGYCCLRPHHFPSNLQGTSRQGPKLNHASSISALHTGATSHVINWGKNTPTGHHAPQVPPSTTFPLGNWLSSSVCPLLFYHIYPFEQNSIANIPPPPT